MRLNPEHTSLIVYMVQLSLRFDFLNLTPKMWTPENILELCCEFFQNGNLSSNTTTLEGIEDIPRTESCCLLRIVGYELDALSNEVHPIYKPINDGGNRTNLTNNAGTDTDFSQYPFIKPIWIRRDDWEIWLKTVPLVPLVVMAVLGNLAVIRVILKARLTRNPLNVFILNMSFADLLCALIFPWIFLVVDFYQKYVLGEYICKYEAFVLTTLMLCSVWSLTVISYDRLTAVVFPFKKRMKPKCARIIIYCIWIISLGASSPLIIWREYKERQWKDFLEMFCKEDPTYLQLFWSLILVVLVWVPLAALSICYTAILIKLESLEKRHKGHPVKQVKWKSRVVRMFFVVLIAFCICWIPYTAFIFVRSQEAFSGEVVSRSFQNLFFISHYLTYVNCAINPIIYGLKNDNLKREFRNTMPTCLKRKKTIGISTVYKTPGDGDGQNGLGSNLTTGDRCTADKLTKRLKTKESPYYWNSGKDKDIPSLSSYERRNSALIDLGLPVPTFSSYLEDDWNLPN